MREWAQPGVDVEVFPSGLVLEQMDSPAASAILLSWLLLLLLLLLRSRWLVVRGFCWEMDIGRGGAEVVGGVGASRHRQTHPITPSRHRPPHQGV